jgi:hypothetical protein
VFRKRSLLERWLDNEGTPHLYIIGRTGAGKTSLCKRILLFLLSRDEKVAVLDFDAEYTEIPASVLRPPFPIPRDVSIGWLLSQAFRPDGGGAGIYGVFPYVSEIESENENNIDQLMSRIKHDLTLPYAVRFAFLWRLKVLKDNFVFVDEDIDCRSVIYDLSKIKDLRARQVAEQILASMVMLVPCKLFVVVEESIPGSWMNDVLIVARRYNKRLILISQRFPEQPQNFEILLFTPYMGDLKWLYLPVNPSKDKGLWWIGTLGTHRLKYTW